MGHGSMIEITWPIATVIIVIVFLTFSFFAFLIETFFGDDDQHVY